MKNILLFVLAFIAQTAVAQVNEDAQMYYNEARKAEKDQNWNKADSYYLKAIKEDPNNALYFHSRGTLNMLLGRDAKALPDINRAVALAPDNPKMHLLKAKYFNYNDLPDSALIYIQNAEALEMKPRMAAEAKIARGDAFRLLNDYQRSYENYEQGLATDSSNAEALENIALVLYKLDDAKQAAHYLQQLLRLNPYMMETYINVGYIYGRIGMFLESVSYSDEALKFDPQNPIALANKAYALYRLESYDEAMTAVNKSLKNMPANPMALKTRAMLTVAKEGKTSKVCADLEKALKYGYNDLYDDGEVDVLIEQLCK